MKKFVVKLDERGYFGEMPWTPVPIEDATKMTSKEARKVQNRMTSYNMGYPQAVVEEIII
jgi:hypothetical protein